MFSPRSVAVKLQFSIQIEGLDTLSSKFQDFAEQAADMVTQTMLDSANENIIVVAKALVPKRTGALAGAIEALPGEEPMQILIAAEKFYAPFLEYGTSPHEIVAKSAKALHWVSGGANYFAKSVQHPGIPAGKFAFIGPAIEEGIAQLVKDVQNMIGEELQ